MYDRKRANEIIRAMWERDKALLVKDVEKELRSAGLGRATDAVAKAVKKFLGPSGQPGADAVAFLVDAEEPAAVSSRSDAPKKSRARSKTARNAVSTSVSETENASLKNELARMAEQVSETADRLARWEKRLLAQETANAPLEAEHAHRGSEARETAKALARLEGRLLVLETDDDRMLNRVIDAHGRRREMFPERVRNAVSEIRRVRDTLTTHDIMEMLPPELYLEAKRLRQPLNLRTLAEKLGVDVSQDGRRDSAVNE